MAYQIDFKADFATELATGNFDLVEVTKAPTTWSNPPMPTSPTRITHDGTRLVLPLGPEHTADNTYSTTEVASTRRFDQATLDQLLAQGSARVMTPGRQAIFKNLLFSDHFADGRAIQESVTAGVIFQSWRGIEDLDQRPDERPAYMAVTLSFIGGNGLLAKAATQSWGNKRTFVIGVIDFNTGLQWLKPLRTFDPATPHDIALRWLPNRDVSFMIDHQEVAYYADGRFQVSPLKLFKKYRRQIDFMGYRHLTADPCQIDCWINCSETGSSPDVNPGKQFRQDLWVALSGFAIEPVV